MNEEEVTLLLICTLEFNEVVGENCTHVKKWLPTENEFVMFLSKN